MTTADVLVELRGILEKDTVPGAVLVSGGDTLVGGSLYVMALNPGGSAADGSTVNVLSSLSECMGKRNHNEWFYEPYDRTGKFSPFQRRVSCVFEALGADPCRTLSTNALFRKSSRASGIESAWQYWWETCWPAHRCMLAIVRPKVVVCLGNGRALSPWELMRLTKPRVPGHQRYNAVWDAAPLEPAADGKWRDAVNLDLGPHGRHTCAILGLPHPSGRVVKPWPLNAEAMRKIGLARRAANFAP